MEKQTLEERVARLEALQRENGAVNLAVHDLLVTLLLGHPDRDAIAQAFLNRRERFMAMALNSALPTDEWLQLSQAAAEGLVLAIGGRLPGPG